MAAPVIPDAGVYGAETAQATNAYNNAVAQATAQRNALYHSYGLNNDASVDPNNPGGAYQMMLQQQAQQFQGDQDQAQQRGLAGPGLGNRAEGQDRAADVGQDFQFQSNVAGVGSDFENALQDALTTRQGSESQAYNDALNAALQAQIAAIQGGDYTAPGTGTGTTSDPIVPPTNKPLSKWQLNHPQYVLHHNKTLTPKQTQRLKKLRKR